MKATKKESESYAFYKGLQQPLMFRGFKGKFIYYAIGSVLCGLFIVVGTSYLFGMVFAGITMIVWIIGSLSLITIRQKKGLYKKQKNKEIFIVTQILK